MKNITLIEGSIDGDSRSCINCKHCYIPEDFIIGIDSPKLYCNANKDKPLSGCILTEPLDYYDIDIYQAQDKKWKVWANDHKVSINAVCDLFERVDK